MAIIRLSGEHSLETIQRFFSAGRQLKPRYATYGFIEHPDLGEGIFDDVVVTWFPAPNSATGEDVVEISLHGGAYLQQTLLALLSQQDNVRLATPGEFTLRAFLNGKMDLSSAEAVAEAIHAQDAVAHRQSQRHLHGNLRSYVSQLKKDLLKIVSIIEAELDFSDQEIEMVSPKQHLAQIESLVTRAQNLLDTYFYGQRLVEGFRVPLVGAPNTGKSSIFNILQGYNRAIVTDVAGTTRDTIEAPISIAGHTVVLVDTAGVRESKDKIEVLGVDRTRQELERADIVLSVQSTDIPPEDFNAGNDVPVIRILNKSDLAQPGESGRQDLDAAISCVTGEGFDGLRQKLAETILGMRRKTSEGLIITSQRQAETLRRLAEACQSAVVAINNAAGPEYVASDLRNGLTILGEITGETTPDDILGEIFGSFCIGK